MAKKKGNKSGKKPKKSENDAYVESREHHDGLDLEGADAYEADQDEQILSKMNRIHSNKISQKMSTNDGNIEELFALSGDSDSDDDDNQFYTGGNSDIDDDQDNVENEEDARAWGSKKKHFYGGNPNEKKKSREKTKEDDDELDEAIAEEIESKALQKKQLEKLDDEDFFDTFAPDFDQKKPENKSVNDKITLDLKQLTQKERLLIFRRDSPEFEGILNDFFVKMKEIQETLQPILDWFNDGKIKLKENVLDYVKTKHKLSLNYCVNILTYLMFKTKHVNLKLHPLTKRLVQFKQLLDQLTNLDEIIGPQLQQLLLTGPPIQPEKETVKPKKKKKPLKKLKMLSKNEKPVEESNDKPPTIQQDLTMDEKIALEVYEAMKSKKKSKNDRIEDENDDLDEDEPMETNENEDEEDESEERRAITYQIQKNKGLQPKRSKLNRNPRVKHRVKFQKAKVRRKGQVREVRTEVKKYGGEMSGINARVKKGIKLS